MSSLPQTANDGMANVATRVVVCPMGLRLLAGTYRQCISLIVVKAQDMTTSVGADHLVAADWPAAGRRSDSLRLELVQASRM